MNPWQGPIEQIDDYRFRIPTSYMDQMRVPGLIYANAEMLEHIKSDSTPIQVANVACLPGIIKYSIAMPDIHWGYGFSIGGVGATEIDTGGIISPGGVGSDINCGVRLLRTNLTLPDIKDRLPAIVNGLLRNIPSGVGSHGSIKLSPKDTADVLHTGTQWAVSHGYGIPEDVLYTEEHGKLPFANPEQISERALERGHNQLGTLGSGNHFLEIQVVDEVFDLEIASIFGLREKQITIMIHTGSRGLGYQVCEDYLRSMGDASRKYGIFLPDRQLACAPVDSPEGKGYLGAMACAANYAWANRQCIMHLTRGVFERILGLSDTEIGMQLVYDVAHNIAKIEKHMVNGKERRLCVHRKGATRAFPANHPDIPERYKDAGQPVIVPGDMGRASYVLVGTQLGMDEAFGTACHGAGRIMSRTRAIKEGKGRSIARELADKGIIVRSSGKETLSEEMPEAYKDVNVVVNILSSAGIAKKVAKIRPLGVVKG
ncbi:RtcB family protein [Candidatus Desantisbacteria bacterium]|nr:RtcB family protein [Candidatus Desantisbacteria bacterium]